MRDDVERFQNIYWNRSQSRLPFYKEINKARKRNDLKTISKIKKTLMSQLEVEMKECFKPYKIEYRIDKDPTMTVQKIEALEEPIDHRPPIDWKYKEIYPEDHLPEHHLKGYLCDQHLWERPDPTDLEEFVRGDKEPKEPKEGEKYN